MAENETTPVGNKQVLLSRIYVKDCSFESPRAPEVFMNPMNPEVKVNMRTANKRLDDGQIEVVLTVTAEAIAENRSVFLAEVHQAGLFTVSGFNDMEMAAIMASYCPSILFPYAREVISDLVMKGSMPALLLQPVNFDMILAQSLAESTAAANG
ncbi:MAG TPA: protein-export chaperone SecB [Gammaproteobacteria bacterium]|nr:protein-export chaperone SecB [Gammaproteobacteria bacterium]